MPAAKVIVSVLELPSVTLPSQVMSPVACRPPLTKTLLLNTTDPVPDGLKFISVLDVVALIVFVLKFKLSVPIVGAIIVGLLD